MADQKTKKNYTYAVGRRKTATARARLYNKPSVPGVEGEHQLMVNGVPAEQFFPSESQKSLYRKPFILTSTLQKMSASVVVAGSGKNAQLHAVVHAISRTLALIDRETNRPILKPAGLLTRDSRAKESRKVGTGGKARRSKQSPKR